MADEGGDFFLLAAIALDGRILNRGRGDIDCDCHVIYSGWFECLMESTVSPKVFKQQFRLSKSTFEKMVEMAYYSRTF